MKKATLSALAMVWMAAGCAGSGASTTKGPPPDFKPEGAVYSVFDNASFDANNVVGSKIDMHKRADGTWAGRLNDEIIDINVYPDRFAGANLRLNIERQPGGYVLTGLFLENQIRFEVLADHFLASTKAHNVKLAASGPGRYGPLGEVHFDNKAAGADAPMPQTALALLAAFVGSGTSGSRSGMGGGMP